MGLLPLMLPLCLPASRRASQPDNPARQFYYNPARQTAEQFLKCAHTLPAALERVWVVGADLHTRCRLLLPAHQPGLVDAAGGHFLQLGHPVADVVSLGVVILQHRSGGGRMQE
jgi:hypothetical protein